MKKSLFGQFIVVSLLVVSMQSVSLAEEGKHVGDDTNQTVNTGRDSSGIATWRVIPQGASDVSLVDKEHLVRSRRGYIALDTPEIYAETLLFDNGSIFYKRDRGLNRITDSKSAEARKALLEDYLQRVRDGDPVLSDVGNLQLVNRQPSSKEYLISYAKAQSNNAYCAAFYKAIDLDYQNEQRRKANEALKTDSNNLSSTSTVGDSLAKSAIGVFCYPRTAGKSLDQRVEEVVALAESLMFDGGELAQAASLEGITQEVHAYWSRQDQSAPVVTLTRAEYSNNEIFVSGKATDVSGIGFVKVAGERLSKADFDKVIGADGSFTIHAKYPVGREPSFSIGDKFGNATNLGQDKFKSVASINNATQTLLTLQQNKEQGKTYILLAGVGDYSDASLPDLLSPKVDIQRVEAAFKGVINTSNAEIIPLVNPTKKEFLTVLEQVRDKFRYGDQLMLYYAGHGIIFEDKKSGTEDGYWSFNDTKGSKPESWLSNNEMKNLVSGFSDGGTLLIADSCFSGAFINDRYVTSSNSLSYKAQDSVKAKLAFTSAGRNPVPDVSEGMNSAFALSFVKSVQEWAAKARARKEPNMPGFFVYLDTRLKLLAKNQKVPQYGNFTDDAAKVEGNKVPDFMIQVN